MDNAGHRHRAHREGRDRHWIADPGRGQHRNRHGGATQRKFQRRNYYAAVGATPWKQRTNGHQEDDNEEERPVNSVEEGLPYGDGNVGRDGGDYRIHGAPKGDERDGKVNNRPVETIRGVLEGKRLFSGSLFFLKS